MLSELIFACVGIADKRKWVLYKHELSIFFQYQTPSNFLAWIILVGRFELDLALLEVCKSSPFLLLLPQLV